MVSLIGKNNKACLEDLYTEVDSLKSELNPTKKQKQMKKKKIVKKGVEQFLDLEASESDDEGIFL